jgi:hypothetical protein
MSGRGSRLERLSSSFRPFQDNHIDNPRVRAWLFLTTYNNHMIDNPTNFTGKKFNSKERLSINPKRTSCILQGYQRKS